MYPHQHTFEVGRKGLIFIIVYAVVVVFSVSCVGYTFRFDFGNMHAHTADDPTMAHDSP